MLLRNRSVWIRVVWLALVGWLLASPLSAAPWDVGDVAVGATNGTILVLDGTTLAVKDTIAGVIGFPGDLIFDAAGNLYVADRDARRVVVFSATDPHPILRILDNVNGLPFGVVALNQSSALSMDAAGRVFVADGNRSAATVHIFDADGNFDGQLALQVFGGSGVTSMDLSVDQATFIYTAIPDNRIKKSPGGTTITNLITLGGSFLHTVRILPPGDGTGGYLIARQGSSSSSPSDVARVIESASPVVQVYDLPSENTWRAIALTPDATAVWAGSNRNLARFDLASGGLLTGPTDIGFFIHRLAVVGEYRAGRPALPPEPDLALSSVSADPQIISSFGGLTTITVQVVDADLNALPGRSVVLAASSGNLAGAVIDNGDGSYSQMLEAVPGPASITVTVTVDGDALLDDATVTLVNVDTDASTITIAPASTYLGGYGVIVFTPRDDQGNLVAGPATVVLETTLGNLAGALVANPDGTYSQLIEASAVGTASVTATYDDLPIRSSGSFTVLDPAALGAVFGTDALGTEYSFASIQAAVNAAVANGLTTVYVAPGFHPEVVLVKDLGPLTLQALSLAGEVTIQGLQVTESSGVTVDGFTIDATDGRKQGVVLSGKSKASENLTLRNCTIHSAEKGVEIGGENAGVLLDGCTVRDNSKIGVEVKGKAGPVTLLGCTIRDNGEHGIKLGPEIIVSILGCTITGNGFAKAEGFGICADVGKDQDPTLVTLIGNVLSGNNGKHKPGKSDAEVKNYHSIIDETDSQPPYTP